MRRALGTLGAVALAQVGLAAGCVDGVTPDCSAPGAPCGPGVDEGGADAELDRTPDTSDAPDAADSPVFDAERDANLDAGDEV